MRTDIAYVGGSNHNNTQVGANSPLSNGELSLEYISDNVVTAKINLTGEKIINQDHLYNVVHSRSMDCNPHTKVKYDSEAFGKLIDGTYVVFVPSSATEPIVLDMSRTRPGRTGINDLDVSRVIIDIRSLNVKGKAALRLFSNIISDFSVSAQSAMGKKGTIYMTPSNVSNSPNRERPKCPLKGKVTILIDRYTLCELDEYCAMLLAYFYKHFTVKGTPHAMYKYVFKDIVVKGPTNTKCTFAIPVLKLNY